MHALDTPQLRQQPGSLECMCASLQQAMREQESCRLTRLVDAEWLAHGGLDVQATHVLQPTEHDARRHKSILNMLLWAYNADQLLSVLQTQAAVLFKHWLQGEEGSLS